MSGLYSVILDSPNSAGDVYALLTEQYGDDHVLWHANDAFFLVHCQVGSCRDIAQAANLSEKRLGVVFELGRGFAGFTAMDLWSWLEEKT